MDDELQKRMNKLSSTIKDLKTNQTIGGDSWVLYRTKALMTLPAGQWKIQIDFIPDITGDFVATAYLVSTQPTGFTYFSEPCYVDPNYQGRWYRREGSPSAAITIAVLVYSTREGKIVLTKTAI